jgi:hypothetical protein
MSVYLVTASEDYYPAQADGDWIIVTPDHAEALREYQRAMEIQPALGVYLIRIDERSWEDITP